MSVIPTWLAATPGFVGQSGQVNQFLGSHNASFLTSGTVRSGQTTGTAVYNSTQTQWTSQLFQTASTQTSVAYLLLQISTIGGSPTSQLISPLTVSVYADVGGVPGGPALASTSILSSAVYSSPFWLTVPLVLAGLTVNTEYHIVIPEVGTTGHYYVWQQSNQPGGAATSPDGVTWTNQTYGLLYQIEDLSGGGLAGLPIQYIYEDGGARITQFLYNANGSINQIIEYTVAQGSGNAVMQTRTLSYTNGLLTGVS